MHLEHLKLFVRVSATRNISAAGKELGLSPAVAGSYLSKLEEELGVRLVHRTTRKVALTEEGEAFLPHAEDVLGSVDAARASVGAGEASPTGTLRITASASFGRMHLMPALPGFLARYPRLSVDLRLSDTIVDLVEGGFDVAIRNAELRDSTLIARRLAPDRRVVCAAPAYIAKHGVPVKPDDLRAHECIPAVGVDNWTFETNTGRRNIKVAGRFRTDNGEAVRDACVAGMGITVNSTWSAFRHLRSGELVELLEDFPLVSDTAIWAVYPSSRLLAPKVRAFIDFLSAWFGDTPYWEHKDG